jgi:prepilin-type N-terminal cleavage/methylation domain-containing protein
MHIPASSFPRRRHKGFTLVEILIVVVIIGLLVALAIPAMQNVRKVTIANRVAADLKTFAGAFEQAALENGTWPTDGIPRSVPPGMDGALPMGAWGERTPAGGFYDWDQDVFGITAAVSIDNPTVDLAVLQRIDDVLDDGDLATGIFRQRSGGVMYILEE